MMNTFVKLSLIITSCSGFFSPALLKSSNRILHGKTSPLLSDVSSLSCPESLEPLKLAKKFYGLVEQRFLETERKDRKYPFNGAYYDLTIPSESQKPIWEIEVGSSFFQNPLISGIYERGYRQNFKNYGFPGPEEEYREVDELFSAAGADTIMDLSCGPGFMARKLVESGKYSKVIAADLSPDMLRETQSRFKKEKLPLPTLIRADAASLPLASSCLDGIHAGAAMHCWPRLSQSLREVYRVLKPGGVFYTSTILRMAAQPKWTTQRNIGFRYFESCEEIETLLKEAGFEGERGRVVVRKEGRACAIVKGVKAPIPDLVKVTFANQTISSTAQLGSNVTTVTDAVSEISTGVTTTIKDVTEDMTEIISDVSENVTDAIIDAAENITESITEVTESVIEEINELEKGDSSENISVTKLPENETTHEKEVKDESE